MIHVVRDNGEVIAECGDILIATSIARALAGRDDLEICGLWVVSPAGSLIAFADEDRLVAFLPPLLLR